MADPTILSAGLSLAKTMALLPEDANFAILGVKEGAWCRVGMIAKAGEVWRIAADLGYQPTTKDWDARVMLIAKW